jgi:hypothetical protein
MKSALLFAAVFVVWAFPVSAKDAKCSRSCTDLKNGCAQMGGNPAACAADFGNCMSTGNYNMPSGRRWTNICKK